MTTHRTRTASHHVPIGVILKTWGTGECTRFCLAAIAEAQALPEELAIVDLGTDEVTRQFAEDLTDRHSVRLHWLPVGRRLAPSEANRYALETLSTPLACLLDNDVIVPRNWLGPMTTLLTPPDVGLVAPIRPDPFVRYPGRDESTEAVLDALKGPGRTPAEITHAFTNGVPLDEFGRAVQRLNGLERAVAVEFPSFLSSCCLGFNRLAVEEAGGIACPIFDSGYGSEDVDLSWRVMDAGYSVIRTSDVFVLHLRHTSLEANGIDFQTELREANRLLYARWRKKLRAWARARAQSGDSLADLSRRFIIRELLRNTSFATELPSELA